MTTRRLQRHAPAWRPGMTAWEHGHLGGCRQRRNVATARQRVCSLLTVLGLSLLLLLSAQAQEDTRGVLLSRPQRVALVIGNSQYATAPLSNPVNDATDIAEVLGKVGFAVTLIKNADQAQIETAVTVFVQQLSRDSVGLFYFSGHGIQVGGQNYLLPIGTAITAGADVKYKAVPAGWVQERMETARNALNILILDACRNNPLTRQWRSGQQGLAPMHAGIGADTLLAFATLPGQEALDGKGRNSPYTRHLLQQISTPGLQVEEVFKRVRAAVVQETGGKQRPQDWNASTREFRGEGEKRLTVAASENLWVTDSPRGEGVKNLGLMCMAPQRPYPLLRSLSKLHRAPPGVRGVRVGPTQERRGRRRVAPRCSGGRVPEIPGRHAEILSAQQNAF